LDTKHGFTAYAKLVSNLRDLEGVSRVLILHNWP